MQTAGGASAGFVAGEVCLHGEGLALVLEWGEGAEVAMVRRGQDERGKLGNKKGPNRLDLPTVSVLKGLRTSRKIWDLGESNLGK